jgi:hypothetical protein
MDNIQKGSESERKRNPVNKPEQFIEHLDLLNLLPNNHDKFLRKLSAKSERYINQQERLKEVCAENKDRKEKGLESLQLSSEESAELFHPYFAELKKMYADYLDTLPEPLKIYVEKRSRDWRFGERLLNMLAVEHESIELIISQRKLSHEFQQDYKVWASEQISNLSEKELFAEFCDLIRTNRSIQERFNAKKYELEMPEGNMIFLFPNINEKLHFQRGLAGSKRRGFTGFYTRLADNNGFLGIAAEGLIGIILKQNLTGSPPIEIDRLRQCEFCNRLLYAYKGNQKFCSPKCVNASHKELQRNDGLSLLKKKLKKANARLKKLQHTMDDGAGLVTEQIETIKEIEMQIEQEKLENGTL